MSIKIKRDLIHDLAAKVALLSKPVTNDEGKTHTPKFKEPGRIRHNLGRTLRALTREQEEIDRTREEYMEPHAAVQREQKPLEKELIGPHLTAFKGEFLPFLRDEVEVDIRPVKLSDLDLAVNNIPHDVWGPLLGIVIEDDVAD